MAMDASSFARGVSRRHVTLAALAAQTTAHVLVLHYSRVMPGFASQRYFISTALLLSEIIKLTISLTMTLFDAASNPRTADTATATALFKEVGRVVFTGDSWQLAVPATLYALQNASQYVAIGNMGVATFQVTAQLKLVSTALFGAFLVGGRASDSRRWTALALLTLGVVLVQIPTSSSQSRVLSVRDLHGGQAFHEARAIWDLKDAGNQAAEQLSKRSATYEGIDNDVAAAARPQMNASLGLVAALVATVLSGFTGTLWEKKIKEPRSDLGATIWVRNVQLSLYSLFPSIFVGIFFRDVDGIAMAGFFSGYNWVVWTAVVLQAVGGIVMAWLVKTEGTMSKAAPGGVSIVLTFLLSLVLFDDECTPLYLGGAALAVAGIYMLDAGPVAVRPRLPPIRVSEPEKSLGNGGMGYFDLESNMTPAKSPLRPEQVSMSSSRPGTPTHERRHVRTRSPELKLSDSKLSKRVA